MANPQHTGELLTVAMIVRDEEATLPATLASIGDIADEVVIVDTGSSDGTREVVAQYGHTAHAFQWDDDFAAARNHALSLARGEWVLWLDAGETLTADDARNLRGFLEANADPATAYALLVQMPRAPENASGEQAARVRLVPRREGLCFVGRVRESLTASLAALGIATEGLPWRIHRGERENDPELKASRAKRNLVLAERAIRKEGASASLMNCMGDALATLGRHERARECFAHAKKEAESGSSDMLEAYYGLLTSLDHAGGDFRTQQLNFCLEAIEVFPVDAQLLCAMGGYLQVQGRPDLACRSYETAYRHGQSNPEVWHLVQIGEVAAVCYSLSLQLQQRDEEARQAMQEAVESNPRSERLRRHLLELLVKCGQRSEALRHLDYLEIEHAERDSLRGAVRGGCLAAEKNWIAARAYLKTALEQGCRDPLALRWYVATLLALGELKAARELVDQWLADQPSCIEAIQLESALSAQPEVGDEQPALSAEPAPLSVVGGAEEPGAGFEKQADRRIDVPATAGNGRSRPLGPVGPLADVSRSVNEPPAGV